MPSLRLPDVGGAPRDDPVFAPAFAKNPADEDLLQTLNAALAPAEEASYLELEERYPTLHVVGVPRSGTTLLYQAIVAGLEIGYVSNLVAAFWRAPVLGLRLARKLGIRSTQVSFESSFGRTAGVGDPHEFGYFWNHHLRYPGLAAQPAGHEHTIDWARLRTVLLNMAHWNAGPIAFKTMLVVWHLERLAAEMPRTCYVWIRRDPRTNALSLLEMRMALYGSYERWASLRPNGPDWLADEPPWRQVVGQVLELERTIDGALERLQGRVLRVEYEELCSAPRDVLDDVQELLAAHGHAPARRALPVDRFEPRRGSPLEAEFGERIDAALADFTAAAGTP
jgi:hypothetical protein